DAAELRVRVELEILALVEEAAALCVHQHAIGIGEPVRLVSELSITVRGGVGVDRRRVTTCPLPMREPADGERHSQAIAGVVPGAADLGVVPRTPEMARAPLGVRLEAATAEHHGASGDLPEGLGVLHADPGDTPALVLNEADCARAVADLDAALLRDLAPA